MEVGRYAKVFFSQVTVNSLCLFRVVPRKRKLQMDMLENCADYIDNEPSTRSAR